MTQNTQQSNTLNTFDYKEFVIGDVRNRNKNISKSNEFVFDRSKKDIYQSVYSFNEDFRHYVTKNKSVEKYNGVHTLSNELYFDFDVPKGTPFDSHLFAELKNTVASFCQHLEKDYSLPINCLTIYFSGMKGFGVSIPIKVFGNIDPSPECSKIIKSVATEIAKGYDFFDESIYSTTSILRIPQTMHSVTGLYKTQITYDELVNLSMTAIVELAKNPRSVNLGSQPEPIVNEKLRNLFLFPPKNEIQTSQIPSPHKLEDSNIISILHGVQETKRTISARKLCGIFMKKGMSEDFALGMLRNWNLQNTPPLPVIELEHLITDLYKRYSNNDTETDFADVYDFKSAGESYSKFVEDLDKKKVLIGYPAIDAKTRGLIPGEVMVIQGKTSIGKSALLQNIGHNYANATGEPVLFFSLEMPLRGIFERSLQIEFNISGEEIEKMFVDDPEKARSLTTQLQEKLPNFGIIDKTGLTIEKMKKYIEYTERNKFKRKIGLVLVDYLGLVKGKTGTTYDQVSDVARGLKDLAKEMDVPIIVLTQVNKTKGTSEMLDINSARDSGCIAESADIVLSIWEDLDRSVERDEHKRLIAAIQKNRKGGNGQIPFKMHRKSLIFEEDLTIYLKNNNDHKSLENDLQKVRRS